MASKKSVLDMIKAEHKENIQKSNETKTIVIKLNIEDFEHFQMEDAPKPNTRHIICSFKFDEKMIKKNSRSSSGWRGLVAWASTR